MVSLKTKTKATSNIVFPYLIEKQAWEWGRIILIWLALMVIGVAVSLPRKKRAL